MKQFRWRWILRLAIFFTFAPAARAQNIPHLGYVYPAGGRQGSTFQVTVGGQHLTSATRAFVSGGGVEVRVLQATKPLSPKEFILLKDKLQQLLDQKAARGGASTAADEKALAEIRKKLANPPNRQANPALVETVTLQVRMAPDAEPDPRELRLVTPTGVSNPLVFCVGQLPEFTERKRADNTASKKFTAPKANPKKNNKNPQALGDGPILKTPKNENFKNRNAARTRRNPEKMKQAGRFVRRRQAGARGLESMTSASATNSVRNPRTANRNFRGKKPGGTAGFPNTPAQEIKPLTGMRITLPATVNGQIMPGEVDRIHFTARKGMRLVAALSARTLIPYLADAVPGWFQATLGLYDAQGRELAYADDDRFNPDPVLTCELPADGEYTLEIKDAIYRGREDFVYRLALGELPHVAGIFPLGGPAGVRTEVAFQGWNLPLKTLAPTPQVPGVYLLSQRKAGVLSNGVPFAVDTLPECLEREGNDRPREAQALKAPTIVNGRIDRPGDEDVFRIEGPPGSRIVAEVSARRLGSPLDSVLRLTDAAGKSLAVSDDREDKGEGLLTHHADSLLSATVPADGVCILRLGDVQRHGGPDHAYRLRVGAPRPDFELRIAPSSLSVRPGATVPLTVLALRKDGFEDDITLALKDPPPGFALSGGWVPARHDQIQLTLTVPPQSRPEPFSLTLEGRARIQGREVVRPVVPAEDMMQAFFYRHLVPAKELRVAMVGRGVFRVAPRIIGAIPIEIPSGGTAHVRITAPKFAFGTKNRLELSDPPEGITLRKVTPLRGGGLDLVFQSDGAKVKPGLKGNLLVEAAAGGGGKAQPAGKGAAPGNKRRGAQGTLPAIPFAIVGP